MKKIKKPFLFYQNLIKFFLSILFLFISVNFSIAQTTITIETGSAGTDDAVLDPYYNYNYSQQIYLSSEITADGGVSGQQITKIRFFYYADAGTETQFDNWTVYAGNTTKSSFSSTSDWVPLASMTQVFSGTVTFPSAGNWVEITLSSPFTWTGNNLVIAVDENKAGYASDVNCWRYTSTSDNKTIYYNNDGTNPNPASPPTATGRTLTRPDVQLVMITPCGAPTSITTSVSPSSSCSNPQSVTFDVSGSSGGMVNGGSWEYQWEDASSAVMRAWSTTSAYTTSLSATTTYHVHMRSTACTGSISSGFDAVYTKLSIPSQPSVITGPTSPCQGSSQTYSVTNVGGVTYTWSFPAGWTQTGGGTTNSVTVTVGASAGNVQVTPSNSCGSGTPRSLAVTVSNVPAQPSAISGLATPCQGSSQAYSVTNVGGVTYTWSFPAGWSQTGGGTTNSVTATVGASSGNIQVTPSNGCGNGTARTLAVSVTASPSQPSAITGATNPCLGSSQTYSVTNVGGVTYSWSFPAGWVQTGGGTTNSVTVTVGAGTGNISVTPSNGSCSGTAQTLGVTVNNVPAQPSAISGLVSPCAGSTQNYNVTNVGGVTYNWSFPAGWTQTGGGTTNSITVTPSATSGNITVTPSNVCGNGTPRNLAVTPGAGPTVTISPNPVSACGGGSVTLTASGSTNYTWASSPAVSGINGATGASVTGTPTSNTSITVTETTSGCNNYATMTVGVGPSVSITASASPTSVCPGTNVSLTSTPSQGSQTLFNETFEGADTWTKAGNFAIGTPGASNTCTSAHGGSKIMANVLNGSYASNCTEASNYAISATINCSGYTGTSLTYWSYSRWENNCSYDWGKLYISNNNGSSWTQIEQLCNDESGWTLHTINISSYADNQSQVKLKFTMKSDGSVEDTGWDIDDIIITGSTTPTWSYSWSSSPAGYSASTQNPTANPAVNTTYTVTVTQTTSGCTATASAGVTIYPIPSTPVISGTASACFGTAGLVYSVTPVSNATTYTWTVPSGSTITGGQGTTSMTMTMGANSGNITCTAYDACGRNNAAATYAVTSLAAPAAPSVTGATACGPQSVSLSASGGSHYHWYDAPSGGNLVNDGPSTYATPVISIPTTYYVAANNGSCDGPRAAVTAGIFNGGLDSYTVTRNTGVAWTDISGSGTAITSWKNGTTHPTGMSDYENSKDDNLSDPIALPFSFPYDGGVQTSVLVGLDGFITFNTATKADGSDLAACGPPEPYTWQNDNFTVSGKLGSLQAIAPFYNDLYCNNAITATCYYKTTGSAPNRVFTVQWTNVYNDIYCSGSSCTEIPGHLYFQVQLYETSGNIVFWYGPTMTQTTYDSWSCESGDDCTVDMDYTVGLNSSTLSSSPTVSQLFTQQSANSTSFSNTPQNNLTTLPAVNSKITLTRIAPAAATAIPSSVCQATYNYPANGSTNQCLNQIISWSPGDGNPTSYNVYFGTSNPPPLVTSTSHTYYNPGSLSMNTTYYWKVVPVNGFGPATNVQTYSFSTTVGDQQPHEVTSNIGTLVSHVASGTDVDGHTIYTNTYEVCPNAQGNGTLTAHDYTLSDGSELDWTTPFYFFGWPIVQCTGAIPSDIWGNCDGGTQSPILTFTSWLTAMFNGGYVIYDVFTRGCNDYVGCTRIILHLNGDNKAPTSVTSSPNPICQGGAGTTLTANGATLSPGANYVWYTGGCGTTFLANTGSSNTLAVNPNVTTTYYVRVEGGTYCASTTGCKSVTVTVNNPVTANAPDISVCTTPITMTGATAGGTVSSITWTGGETLGAWSGSGTDPSTYVFTPSVPNGSFVATLNVYGTAPCGNTSDVATIAWGTGPGGWNGSYSTNWYDDRNWCGYPRCLDDVTIPASTAVLYQPTIDPSQANVGPVPHAANSAASKNMNISSGATLTMTNAANLNVCGDWSNNGTFTAGNGTVTFMGTAAQNIFAPSNNFFNVIIDNSSTGVTLSGSDQTITGILTLNDGVLHTGANKLVCTSVSPTSITYGSDNTSAPLNNYLNSWIHGNLQRNFANNPGNPGTYDFPVGTASFPALARMDHSGLTGISTFDISFIEPASYLSTGSFNTAEAKDFGFSYDFLLPDGIWLIEPNTPPTSGTYSLKLFFNGFDQNNIIDNEFGIIKRPNTSTLASDWTTNPTSGAGPANTSSTQGNSMNIDGGLGRMQADGFAYRFSLTAFSHFGIGKINKNLPVELSYFRALCDNEKTDLHWSTVSESNNDFFTLEKSSNSLSFDFLALIPGAGNSNQITNYSYTDEEPFAGTTYYRLSQTDYDGASEILGVTASDCDSDENNIVIYPNPANSIVYLYLDDDAEETFNIDIYNNIGELVYQKKVNTVAGKNIFTFLTNNFAEGLYTVVINHPSMFNVTYLMIKK